ncbi:MAG: HEAT repeat domain-containing protein [Planctomycetes bacterium]|nr:HEAT repeat domain-containing protein [Planctomycetota bacterium]
MRRRDDSGAAALGVVSLLLVATAFVLGCAREVPAPARTAPTFALRKVCRDEVAKLEALVPKRADPAPDKALDDRVLGLVVDATTSQGKVRGMALREAAELGPAAVPALVKVIDDAKRDVNERRTAVEMLGGIDAPAAADAFVARMDIRFQHEPWLRAHAAFALERQTSDAWVPLVVPLLEYETDAETVLWLASALAKHGNYAGLAGLEVLAQRGAAEQRERAAALAASIATDAGFPDAETLRRAWSGTEGAPPLPPREVSPALRLAQWKAIATLGEFNLRLVDDARYALVNGGPSTVEPLVLALREEDEHVRLHVLQCLERIGPRAKSACAELRALLDEPRTAPGAALALGGVRCTDALPALVACAAKGRAPELRAAAATALGRLGVQDALPTLQRLLDAAEPMDLRQTAAEALLALGDDARAIALLVEALRSRAADQDAAESALETWLAKRAESGDATAKERLDAWRTAGSAITGIPSVEQVESRRAARAELARTFVAK